MATNDLHYLGLVEVGRKIQAKELSPVEATKAMLGRIEQLDGKLKSFAYVMADSALAEASCCREGDRVRQSQGTAARRADRGEGSLLGQRRACRARHDDPSRLPSD